MLVSRLLLILAFCFNVFAKLSEVSNKSFITRFVKRKGRTGSSSSSISSGSSGSTLVSSGQKTNWGNNQYHCSGSTCGYGNYYAPTAAAAAAGYGTARYHGNSTTTRTSAANNIIFNRGYLIGIGLTGYLVI